MASDSSMPYRLLWTWDHSTNWDLHQPGQQDAGCGNPYLKPAAAFLEDYRRLIDHMAGLGLNGLIVWGFLRDSHGGVGAAKELCRYARAAGVRVLPGVGIMAYGGIYYEGNHEFSLARRIEQHPETSALDENGKPCNWRQVFPRNSPRIQALCPSREENVEWHRKAIQWLVETFDIGGINYETGDYGVCHCELCKGRKSGVNILSPGQATEKINVSFDTMARMYPPLMEQARAVRGDLWQVYTPYCGYRRDMAGLVGPFLKAIPPYAICQWTLTHMLDEEQGFPWEDGLAFPAAHNIGFFHEGSQWYKPLGGKGPYERYDDIVPIIRRAADKGVRAGLEGLVTHGEVSAVHSAWERNYRAFSYFTHHPGRSVEDFEKAGEHGRAGA